MLAFLVPANRFIPVYTGNITMNKAFIGALAVYPCVYREHLKRYPFVYRPNGLSLCIQGTLEHRIQTYQQYRFIPVYTGNIYKKF